MMAIEVKDGKPTEEQIRIRAHELWEQAGKPEDRDDEFWLRRKKRADLGRSGDRAHRRLAWRRMGLETISASA
jgi:hypothetical protein